jgi:hypothetical protein
MYVISVVVNSRHRGMFGSSLAFALAIGLQEPMLKIYLQVIKLFLKKIYFKI